MNGEAARTERAVSWKTVTVGFWALLALAFGFAIFIYFTLIRYERIAVRHLPHGTSAAIRLDVEKAVLYEPARKHLLPLANEFGGPRSRFDRRTRLERLHSKSGLELAVDLREVVLGVGPNLSDWVLVFGGRFPRSGVIAGLDQVLREEGYYFKLAEAGEVMSLPSGVSIAQAADGCLVAASSPDRLSLALDAQNTYLDIGLSPRGPGAFAASAAFFSALGHSATPLARGLPEAHSLERVFGSLELGPEVQIRATLELKTTGDPTPAVDRVGRLLGALRTVSSSARAPDFGGVRTLLERAEVRDDGPGRVTVRTLWARSDIDRAAHSLATALRGAP